MSRGNSPAKIVLKKGELISQGDYQHLKQMHGELLAHGSG